MNQADKARVDRFLSKWLGSEGNERANYQGFFFGFVRGAECRGATAQGKRSGRSLLL